MAPEDGLVATLTALENVESSLLGTRLSKPRARARLSLCAVDLAAKMKRYPHQLSEEERRRVVTARALASEMLPGGFVPPTGSGARMKKASAREV